MKEIWHWLAVPWVALMVMFPGNGVFRGLAVAFCAAEAERFFEEEASEADNSR